MDWIEDICRQWDIDQDVFGETGEIICPRCNGTGIDPDYREVNAILVAIDEVRRGYGRSSLRMPFRSNVQIPHCLSCYGMTRIDWIKYANGSYKRQFVERKKILREGFLYEIEPFVRYVRWGEVVFGGDPTDRGLHFDLERKLWIEVDEPKDDINSLREAWKWLNRFKADDYFDRKTFGKAECYYQDLYAMEPEDHIQAINKELLRSKDLSMERLIEIKNDLDLFWRDIGDFNDIGREYRPYGILPPDFDFTWENILRKFALPLSHLAFLNPGKSKAEK
jgi:hypothetical protein